MVFHLDIQQNAYTLPSPYLRPSEGRFSVPADEQPVLVGVRDNVAKLKQGRSLDEIIAAKSTAAFDAKRGRFVITPRSARVLSIKASRGIFRDD